MEREPNTQYILSLSYGKDSLACLAAIEQLGLPLDRIVHAEVWATDTISADLPPMVKFKKKADAIIKERWGIEVEHICAMAKDGTKQTYEKLFYHVPKRKYIKDLPQGTTLGFPLSVKAWCNDKLKVRALDSIADTIGGGRTSIHSGNNQRICEHQSALPHRTAQNQTSEYWDFQSSKETGVSATSNGVFSKSSLAQGAKINTVQYLGIAADEPERIARHTKDGFMLPLVEVGWDEAYCRQWCEENDLLSPIYTTATRGGVLVLPQSTNRSAPIVEKELSRVLAITTKVGFRQPCNI